MKQVKIHHFSDILCVWAYVAQVRIDEVCSVHGDDIDLEYHFMNVFGDVVRLEQSWSAKGGLAAYGKHVLGVAEQFEHVQVHADVWSKVAPRSSMSCHQFLYAVRIAHGCEALARATWALRVAFFAEARDISLRKTQMGVAEDLNLELGKIVEALDSGAALACVARDLRDAAEQKISVSPTMVFNEGRQMLKGNVGYRVIEANVGELLSEHSSGHSWC